MNAQNLLVLIELEALITERAGMEAENEGRLRHDNSISYGDGAFFTLSEKMLALRGKVVQDEARHG